MTDVIVNNLMRLTVMCLIAVLGVGALFLGYAAMLAFFAQRWADAGPALFGGMVVGVCTYLLSYHRSDLVYE
jgi:small-conductance mechanosensitive channel